MGGAAGMLSQQNPMLFAAAGGVGGACAPGTNLCQHYAALGRDTRGASQVNLVPSARPADIYEGVRASVEAQPRAGREQGRRM